MTQSVEVALQVEQGETYELTWTVPDVPVVNVFVGSDGGEVAFVDPDPTPAGKAASRIEIRAEYGLREQLLKPEAFRKNRTPPTVVRENDPIQDIAVKHFAARFKARRPGVQRFEVRGGPNDEQWIRTMKVKRVPRQYNTISEVANDRTAVRRHAILADICDLFPAFNTSGADGGAPKGLATGKPSNIPGQGNWKGSYDFDSNPRGTSCTTVNPLMMGGFAKNDSVKWAFNAGPSYDKKKNYRRIPNSENPAWVEANGSVLPSVGDTYIVLNGYRMYYGHVGIVVHRPPDGNGLWVTADGGQGGKPAQLALLVPRWGIMGAHLPMKGQVPGRSGNNYPKMKPEPDGAVFLSGAMRQDVRHEDPSLVPGQEGDPQGVARWLKFRQSANPDSTSNPRRVFGYVDVEDIENLSFETVDPKGYEQEHVDKCHLLVAKVEKVIEAAMAGKTLVAGT